MATFLKICQDVVRECGIEDGTDSSARPTTVTGQSGELNRIVNYVRDFYQELQDEQDWRWMRKKFTLQTVSGTGEYAYTACTDVDTAAAITRFKSWRLNDRRNPPKIYLTSSGVGAEVFLSFTRWYNFEYLYKTGSLQTQTSLPLTITVNPANKIELGIKPNDIYTVTGDYNMSAQILTADGDTPEMPSDYHRLIMYGAMQWYAMHESAPEVLMRAERGINRIRRLLVRNQTEPFRFGGPVA